MKYLVRLLVASALVLAVIFGAPELRQKAAQADEPVIARPVCTCTRETNSCERRPDLATLSCADYAEKLLRSCEPGVFNVDCFLLTASCWHFDKCTGPLGLKSAGS